jgi:NAD(P)-dependent dehydrogenase (short-subunit alcohol dehydrogenase family)
VSSAAHRDGRIDLDDLNWERRRYRRWAAYGQSKLANLLFTLELDRRLVEAGSPVGALAAHPGYAATNLQLRTGSILQTSMMAVTNRLFAQSDAMGALPTLYAATQDLPGGSYVPPDGTGEARTPDAGGPHGGSQRRGAGEAAVGQVCGPDRRAARSAVAGLRTSLSARDEGCLTSCPALCAKMLDESVDEGLGPV